MGLFNFFKKKAATCKPSKARVITVDKIKTKEYLDDITFIRAIQHIQADPWHQYDVVLAARGYGWENMIEWADYMAEADLSGISQLTRALTLSSSEIDITDSYRKHNKLCSQTPELSNEQGALAIAGNSRVLRAPLKLVFMNQTNHLRFFTFVSDEALMAKYIESTIRRNFGTADAMKLGKPIPKGQ